MNAKNLEMVLKGLFVVFWLGLSLWGVAHKPRIKADKRQLRRNDCEETF